MRARAPMLDGGAHARSVLASPTEMKAYAPVAQELATRAVRASVVVDAAGTRRVGESAEHER